MCSPIVCNNNNSNSNKAFDFRDVVELFEGPFVDDDFNEDKIRESRNIAKTKYPMNNESLVLGMTNLRDFDHRIVK